MTAFSMPPFCVWLDQFAQKNFIPVDPCLWVFSLVVKKLKTYIVLHVCLIAGKKVVASRLRPFKKSIRQMETNGKNGMGLFVCCLPPAPGSAGIIDGTQWADYKWNHNQASFFCAVLLKENNSVTGEPNKRWKGRLASKNTAKWPNWYCGFLGISIQIRFLNNIFSAFPHLHIPPPKPPKKVDWKPETSNSID